MHNSSKKDTTSVPSRLRRGSDCKCCNETMLTDFRRFDEISAWLKVSKNPKVPRIFSARILALCGRVHACAFSMFRLAQYRLAPRQNLAECKAGDKSLNLKTFDFGETFEKRRLNGIEIGSPLPGAKAKPTIWLHANEHAREWLAGSFAIYLINSLVHDPKYKALVDKIHW